jgi:hypothetical protein
VFEMRPVCVRGVYFAWTCATARRVLDAMRVKALQLDSPLASVCVALPCFVCSLFICVMLASVLSFSTPRGESCAPVLRQGVSVDASR